MVGFVGSRAKKRRRNFFLTLIFLILFSIFYFIYPTIEINDNIIVPNDSIVPDPNENIDSLVSNIEDLELELFNKDQKIKFRDGQINNLKTELKKTQLQYENISLELNEIKSQYSILSSDNDTLISPTKYKSLQDNHTELNNINNQNILTIKNLNKKIEKLNNNILSIEEQTNNIIRENQKLKKNNKSVFAKNLRLENNITTLENLINKQKTQIDLHLSEIKKLKDKSHHGG
tara:strand:+ start:2653 stop:3348 length:696 start_codon:yes stop_codon:yes gene_type:complete